MMFPRPLVQLFEELKHRREERKRLKYEIRKACGREFALSEYFEGNASILELESCIETAKAFNKDNAFDEGIEQGIAKLAKMRMPNVAPNTYGRANK